MQNAWTMQVLKASKVSTGISEAATRENNTTVKEILEEKRQPNTSNSCRSSERKLVHTWQKTHADSEKV